MSHGLSVCVVRKHSGDPETKKFQLGTIRGKGTLHVSFTVHLSYYFLLLVNNYKKSKEERLYDPSTLLIDRLYILLKS